MKKILYANGDSFIFGMECISEDPKNEYSKQLSFPRYVADHLRCSQYINNSYNGATNDFIFRKTLFDLQDLENQGVLPEEVFVIVGITSLHRIEIDGNSIFGAFKNASEMLEEAKNAKYIFYPTEYEKTGTVFTNPGMDLNIESVINPYNTQRDIIPFCAKYLWTEAVQLESQEARIYALHEVLKLKGYSHLFVNTVCPLERTQHLDLTCKNFYKLDSESFWIYADSNYPEERQPFNHFNTVPHKNYAEQLIKYIANNSI